MTFEVEVGGRTRSVSIEKAGGAGRYRVAVDGRAHAVEARQTGDLTLVLSAATFPPKTEQGSADKSLEDATLGSRSARAPGSVEVAVAPWRAPGEMLVTLAGRTAVVTVNGRRTGRAADRARHAHGEQAVVAPMPGRVVRVLVAPGDAVTARQGVIVVEAMKMENELRAPKGGRVKDVSVAPGASVEAGRVLLTIE